MRSLSLASMFFFVLLSSGSAYCDEPSPLPPGAGGNGGNPPLGGGQGPAKPSDVKEDGKPEEVAGHNDLAGIRDASLRRSAEYLEIDLDQLYKDRVGEAPTVPAADGGKSAPAADERTGGRMKRVLQQVLSVDNNQSIMTLVTRGAGRMEIINAALNLLRNVTTAESASPEAKTVATYHVKLLADPKNHSAFEEALVLEQAKMRAEEDLKKMEARQKIELELAKAKHAEKLQTLERERLERELGRAQ